MGLSRDVIVADETPVKWPAIRLKLQAVSETPVMRMIDGELSFPDDSPEEWLELRIAFLSGMVTLKRSTIGVSIIIWGNADPALIHVQDLTAWAVASSCGGLIELEGEKLPAAIFAARRKLFPE